jgi:hypothetical protein
MGEFAFMAEGAGSPRARRQPTIAWSIAVGQVFGRLTIAGPVETRINGGGLRRPYYPVRCECGQEKQVEGYALAYGKTVSCGCNRAEKAARGLKGRARTQYENSRCRKLARGERFGKLTVAGPFAVLAGSTGLRRIVYPVRCDCGRETTVAAGNLTRGLSKTCGAPACRDSVGSLKHGEARLTRLYSIWAGMRCRCRNEKTPAYKNYGARGITVCPEWDRYAAFRAWAFANGYAPDLTIDRRDNDGNYEPGNCRWVTNAVQATNTRKTRQIAAFGETKCAAEWARDARCVVKATNILQRIDGGWAAERAIATPRLH